MKKENNRKAEISQLTVMVIVAILIILIGLAIAANKVNLFKDLLGI